MQLYYLATVFFASNIFILGKPLDINKCPQKIPRDGYLTYHKGNDMCYHFRVNRRKTFSDAEQNCERYGGTLAMIKDEPTNKYISLWLLRHSGYNMESDILIGLSRQNDNKEWTWPDKTLANKTYTNWGSGEGGGHWFTTEECAAIAPASDGVWRDHECDRYHAPYVCQYKPVTRTTSTLTTYLSTTPTSTTTMSTTSMQRTSTSTTPFPSTTTSERSLPTSPTSPTSPTGAGVMSTQESPKPTPLKLIFILSTKPATNRKCFQCGSEVNSRPCSVLDLLMSPSSECPVGKDFCMNTVVPGEPSAIYKKCVDRDTCELMWRIKTSDRWSECTSKTTSDNCHYCCLSDGCNKDTVPPRHSLLP